VSNIEDQLTIVIPCFNEAGNLDQLINDLEVEIKKNRFKVVLVDNGSTDRTQEVLARSLSKCDQSISKQIQILHLLENQNYGGGIKAGIKGCETEYVGWFHADLQFHASEISKLMMGMKSGSTLIKGVRKSRNRQEKIFTAGMSLVASSLFQRICRDINGQPTLFRREFLNENNDAPNDFSLDAYFYLNAVRNGASIVRYPVKMIPRTNGVSSWNVGLKSQVKFSYKMIKALLKIRFV
jgi:glycosyltransferase involved in cell wall biosynthesis